VGKLLLRYGTHRTAGGKESRDNGDPSIHYLTIETEMLAILIYYLGIGDRQSNGSRLVLSLQRTTEDADDKSYKCAKFHGSTLFFVEQQIMNERICAAPLATQELMFVKTPQAAAGCKLHNRPRAWGARFTQ
jgi:hypothetical protein